MGDSKQRILTLLNRDGGMTTNELSERLGISATAVRRHLKVLETKSLVFYRSEQRGIGRPSHVYQLVNGAASVFSQSYAAFAQSLIQDLADLESPEGSKELFDRRQKKRHQTYLTNTQGNTLSERVASMARLLESEGRLVTWQQLDENQFVMREHNCPFREIAGDFEHPCQFEISLFQNTLKADVRRVNHILEGDIACVYEIAVEGSLRQSEVPSL